MSAVNGIEKIIIKVAFNTIREWKIPLLDFYAYLIIKYRPLVDTFRMYLCADTDTFPQNVSVPIQIQFQKMYLCADTDTFY